MADTATTTGSDGPEGETPNQRQARLRREKRAKKMTEQGGDRLAKIKALNGGVAPPDEVLGGPSPAAPQVASVADDPDEVDISKGQIFAATPPTSHTPQPPNDAFAAAMQQMQQQQAQAGDAAGDDPIMRMMQQMMGGMGGGPGSAPGNTSGADPTAQLPPFLQAMMKGGQAGGENAPAAPPTTGSTYVWRIVHAVFAFGLAGYITVTSTYNGSAVRRHQDVYSAENGGYGFGPRLFVLFTSVELMLQSTRYFLEKGQLQGPGMLAQVANSGFVPEPYANYIRVLGRYISIAQTIFSDVMVIIFVFGAMAWWKGAAAA